MAEVIPAIIPKTFSELNQKLDLVSGIAEVVHIDILDGKMTAEKSWPNINAPDSNFVKIIREEEAFPFSEDIEYEVHLMVENPEEYIQQWISAGAKRIIVHIESFENPEKALEFVYRFNDQYGGDGSFLVTELGIAIKSKTDYALLETLIPEVDFVQCMSVEEIGSQGQVFDEAVIPKIKKLREMHPDLPISVDGSVNADTAQKLVDVDVDRLIVGSAIFKSGNILGTIEELESLVPSTSN
jgi:ribulose-phosphate 3-epimerase